MESILLCILLSYTFLESLLAWIRGFRIRDRWDSYCVLISTWFQPVILEWESQLSFICGSFQIKFNLKSSGCLTLNNNAIRSNNNFISFIVCPYFRRKWIDLWVSVLRGKRFRWKRPLSDWISMEWIPLKIDSPLFGVVHPGSTVCRLQLESEEENLSPLPRSSIRICLEFWLQIFRGSYFQ